VADAVTIRMLTAEMHVVELGHRAAWAYARAAACPWDAIVVRRARVHECEMEVWAGDLYQELEAWRARSGASPS
jgi:hypothetical protein